MIPPLAASSPPIRAAPRFVWLHGFASGPTSSKGNLARSRLAERGVELWLTDLNQPSFRELTVGRMLRQLDAFWEEQGSPLVLFGSSLGGYTAAAWAAGNPERCAAVVLLAPAFALAPRWKLRMGADEVARWRAERAFVFDHYAWGRKEALGVGFLEDAEGRPDFPLPTAETLVVQGLRDEVVLPALAREFTARMQAAGRKVRLVERDEGHELTQDLPGLWSVLEEFVAPWLPARPVPAARAPERG